MPEFWTNTIKYYRLAIKNFLPFVKDLEKKVENEQTKKELVNIIEMYEDVAKEIDNYGLVLDDPNRFYDNEPDEIRLNLNDDTIEHFSRLTLRLLKKWEYRKEEIEKKDYITQENKEEYYNLKNLIWPLKAQFDNPSMLFSKNKDKGALKFPGEDEIEKTKSKSKIKQRMELFSNFNFYNFHPLIIRVSYDQFQDGYFKEAILNAFVEVINQVKEKSNHPKDANGNELDGDKLMGRVFGCESQKPIIKFNDLSTQFDIDEQRGFMNIFKGIVGLRNKKAHLNFIQNDPLKTIEYLALASLLMRLLDEHVG